MTAEPIATPSASTASSSRSIATASPSSTRPQPDAARQRVAAALLLELEEDRLPLPRLAARPLLERRPARVRLDAAAEAAVAAAPARLDAHVADLARGAAPEDDAAVEHEPAADPGAPEDAEERPDAAAGAEPPLGLDGDVDVVPEHDRDAEALGDHRARAGTARPQPSMFGAWSTTPSLRVDAPRRADADAGELADADARARRRLGDGDRDVAGDRLRAAVARRVSPRLADDPAARGR